MKVSDEQASKMRLARADRLKFTRVECKQPTRKWREALGWVNDLLDDREEIKAQLRGVQAFLRETDYTAGWANVYDDLFGANEVLDTEARAKHLAKARAAARKSNRPVKKKSAP